MSSEPLRAPYQSPLRARLKEQTSLIILDAVATILRDADLSAVTIAEVARVAQVTEQTIYRHYRSRDELIGAFTKHHLDQAVGGPDIALPKTIAEMLSWLEDRYHAWAGERQIVTETYLSPHGRALRQPLYTLGYKNIIKMLGQEHPRLDHETKKHLASAMLVLMSAENFVFMHRNFGYGPEEVHASVIKAINAMLSGAA